MMEIDLFTLAVLLTPIWLPVYLVLWCDDREQRQEEKP